MDKYKKLLSNTAILGIGTFGSKILVFLLLPLYTACLSTAEYSQADIITQSANLLMPILSLGICDAVFRFTMDRELEKKKVLTTGIYVLLGGLMVALAVFPVLNRIEYFDGYMWLIILYALTANLHSLLAQYTRAKGMTSFFAGQGILATALTIGLNVLFLVGLGMGLMGYVLSVVISDGVTSLLIIWVIRREFSLLPRNFSQKMAKSMLKYSIPLIPTTIFWWITNVSDRYMIKGFLGDDINGLYAAAFKIPTLLILLSGIFIEAWQFSAVTERDEGDKKEREIFFGTVFDSFQGMLFMSAAGLIGFSRIFATILFADSFFGAWEYMPLLVSATVYSSLVTFMGCVYLVDKKSVSSFVTSMIGAVVNVVLNLILIPTSLGANGAALATFMSYFVVFIIRAINTRRMIRFNLHSIKLVINTAIIGLQTAFIVFELPYWILAQVIGIVLVLALNAMPILRGCIRIIKRRG